MSNIDQQFIEYVVKSLVGNPDAVKVDRRIDEKGVLLELTVDPEDLGRVIGKRGATAQSLRTLLRALGTKNDARYNLKIVDNGVGGGTRDDTSSDQPADKPLPDAQSSDSDSPRDADASGEEVEPKKVSQPEPQSASAVPKQESETEATSPSDRVTQTRRELAELDDLDV